MSRDGIVFRGDYGSAMHLDGLDLLRRLDDGSVDLVMTSPPYALTRPKEYGNAVEADYCDWMRPFAVEMRRVLKDNGSLVMDFGGAWQKGQPTRSLYQYRVLLMLVDELGFHLAQEFHWWNPSKLPSPAEWVTVRRVRVKDAVNTIWWLSRTPWPKSSNARVLCGYSESQMQRIAGRGLSSGTVRPSGHRLNATEGNDNGAAIPPNLMAAPNTDSNSRYLRHCRSVGVSPHPARFPREIPEFFVRMLTDRDDLVVDPFAGSCTTGEAAERLRRRWLCGDTNRAYLAGGQGRFPTSGQRGDDPLDVPDMPAEAGSEYAVPAFAGLPGPDRLLDDGGKDRQTARAANRATARHAVTATPPAGEQRHPVSQPSPPDAGANDCVLTVTQPVLDFA